MILLGRQTCGSQEQVSFRCKEQEYIRICDINSFFLTLSSIKEWKSEDYGEHKNKWVQQETPCAVLPCMNQDFVHDGAGSAHEVSTQVRCHLGSCYYLLTTLDAALKTCLHCDRFHHTSQEMDKLRLFSNLSGHSGFEHSHV